MTVTGTVLIIDADAGRRDDLARVFAAGGGSVLTASSPSQGIALLSTLRPRAVVLDLDVPGIDGLEILHHLRLESADVPIVAMSSGRDPSHVVRAMRAGAADFIPQPAPVQVVAAAVQSAWARAVPESPVAVPQPTEGEGSWPDWEQVFRSSERMRVLEDLVRRAADTNATLLLHGESGTGKEVIAQAVHRFSERRARPFVKVHCAALPADLLDVDLFGQEDASGAGPRRKVGKLELAHRGTVLLDEIADLAPSLQPKLLQVLQDKQFFRVSGSELVQSDVRIIATTNRDLAMLRAAGTFRDDLFFRLSGVSIAVPPLRDRREEIPRLVEHFLARFCRQYGRDAAPLSAATLRMLQEYHWPGNVRELENMIKRLVVLQNEMLLQEEIALRRNHAWAPGPSAPTLASGAAPAPARPWPVSAGADLGLKEIAKRAALEAEKAVLKEVLDRVRWNRAEAARILKISYKALLYKIAAAGLDGRRDRGRTS